MTTELNRPDDDDDTKSEKPDLTDADLDGIETTGSTDNEVLASTTEDGDADSAEVQPKRNVVKARFTSAMAHIEHELGLIQRENLNALLIEHGEDVVSEKIGRSIVYIRQQLGNNNGRPPSKIMLRDCEVEFGLPKYAMDSKDLKPDTTRALPTARVFNASNQPRTAQTKNTSAHNLKPLLHRVLISVFEAAGIPNAQTVAKIVALAMHDASITGGVINESTVKLYVRTLLDE